MILKTENLSREFVRGDRRFYAVNQVNVKINENELSVIMGQSGSGKSTLFHMLTGILKPTEGSIELMGQKVESMTEVELSELRRGDLGYIMQGQNLLPNLTVTENIMLPVSVGKKKRQPKEDMGNLVELLGIQDMMSEYPYNLSGGEQRRVAIVKQMSRH